MGSFYMRFSIQLLRQLRSRDRSPQGHLSSPGPERGKRLAGPTQAEFAAIRKALEDGGNKNFEADELPGLNHLFQTAKTGSVAEYATIDETISPVALEKIAGWILKSGLASANCQDCQNRRD
jgi:hypothetical protein